MRIVVVCGAGASSTFVAVKLRTAARSRGADVVVEPGSAAQLPPLDRVDVLLVGAHLEAALPGLRDRAAATGTVVAVLPPVSPASLDGGDALDLALDARAAAL